MIPRERVESILQGKKTDKIPVTLYDSFIPLVKDIDSLLQRGLCIVQRGSCSIRVLEGVTIKTDYFMEDGKQCYKTIYTTPVGDVSTTKIIMPETTWTKDYLFKSEEDYKVLEYLFSHQSFKADATSMQQLKTQLGGSYILREQLPLEPMQEFISSDVMDSVTFSYEWYDNQDELLKLIAHNAKSHEKAYEIAAQSPAMIVNYGGNVIPQIIGPTHFKTYYMPYYEKAATVLHKQNKLMGTHLDGDNTPIMDLIAQANLDYVEAYDPSISPTLQVAHRHFDDKVLWINWPSGAHFKSGEEAAEHTRDMIREIGSEGRLIVGVTEDMPHGKWDELLHGIMDGLGYNR